MENLAAPWSSWCRLCAKEDAENNVKFHFSGNQKLVTPGKNVNLTIKEALEKYFWIHSPCEDLLPKHLCSDCYTSISSIMLFKVQVERVQEMYNFLLENPMYDPCDVKSVRIKFDVSDGKKGQWSHQNNTRESFSENIQNTYEDCGAEGSTLHNEQENCDIESNISGYDDNNDVDDESIDMEQELYDEKYTDNGSQKEDEYTFETMSEDTFWGEEKLVPEGTTNNRKSTMNKKEITVRISEHKSQQRESADINCEKKDNTREDFVLDVACKECGQNFDLYSTYCEHMDVSHGNASTDKYCPICDRNLQTWYHLGRHMRVHMPLEARYPVKCPECENRYTSFALLDVHINHKHKRTKPFICEVCGFRGGTQHSLKQHMYMHTDNKPFECEVCKKKFKKKSVLNIHMDIHGPDKFVCSICGLQLNTRATLKKHRVVHSDERRHKCDYCGKAFKRSLSLKHHLLLHTGLKPYPCNFCNLTCSNRSQCRSHMRKKHPEELALLDASGNKAYTKNVPKLEILKEVCRTAAVSNVRSSVGDGSFPCDFCDSRFSYRGSCRHHMRKKHPKEFASMEASGINKNRPRLKKKLLEWFDFGKSEICDFCGHKYVSRICCQAHIRRMHLKQMAAMGASGSKTSKTNVTNLETKKAVTNALQSMEKSKSPKKALANALESMEKSKSPIDLTPCASTTTGTNIQDYFLLID